MLTVEQIRELMADRKITKVAQECGVSRQTIHNIITGKANPSYKLLKKITDYFAPKQTN